MRPSPPSSHDLSQKRLHASKAAKLFEQALIDQKLGNLASARINMKLALTFEPNNPRYERAYQELANRPESAFNATPNHQQRAKKLYEQAVQQESSGQYDKAIEYFERASQLYKHPTFLNRLGVLYATKKSQFTKAQILLEEAIQLAPEKPIYAQNLQKILAMAATKGLQKKEQKPNSPSNLWGLFQKSK